MHHMRVALDSHQLFGFHRAVLADATEIVAAEVDQHDVLSALFFAGEHFFFKTLVFGLVLAAPACPGNWPIENIAPLNLHQHFRRTSGDSDVVHLQEKKIGRRIERAQFAIDVKRLGVRFGGESLADHHLKNIAGADIVLRFAHGLEIFVAAKIGSNAEWGAAFLGFLFWQLGRRSLVEQLTRFANLAHRGVVFRAKAAFAVGVHIADNPQPVLQVIESDDAVIEHQHGVVQADVVAQAFGELLDEADHVVGKIANGAGHERRQTRQAHRAEAVHPRAKKRHRIALFPNDAVAALQHTSAAGVPKDFLGIRAGKCVAGDFFAALHAFQQKGVARTLGQTEISADGSEQVRRKYLINRDKVALFGETLEFAEVGLNHGISKRPQFVSPRSALSHFWTNGAGGTLLRRATRAARLYASGTPAPAARSRVPIERRPAGQTFLPRKLS